MLSDEEIASQQTLLAAHRRTLVALLHQQAEMSRAQTPPAIVNGIADARREIDRIKGYLREADVEVGDHLYDSEHLESVRSSHESIGVDKGVLAKPTRWFPRILAALITVAVGGVAAFLFLHGMISDSVYRPDFLSSQHKLYQSQDALAPQVQRLIIGKKQISFSFGYDLPQQGNDQFAGFLIPSDEPTDVSKYQYLRVVFTLNDLDAKCEIFLYDVNDKLFNIRLDDPPPNQGIILTPSENTRTILIPVSLFQGIDLHKITQLGFHAHTNFVRGQHSIIINDVGFSNK